MFDANELRILISGAPGEIDVNDWRNHSQYRGKIIFHLIKYDLEYWFFF